LVSAAGDDRYEHHVNFKRGLLGVRQQTSSIQGSKDKKQKACRRQAGFLQCEAPKIANLVQITPITMVYGTYNYSYWGL